MTTPISRAEDGVKVKTGDQGEDERGERYVFTNCWTMSREGHGYLWHLRDPAKKLIDKDMYRNDLISRHRLTVSLHVEAA